MHVNSETSSADDGLFDNRLVTRDVRVVCDLCTCATYKFNGGSLDVCNLGTVEVTGVHTHPVDLDDIAVFMPAEDRSNVTCEHDVDSATP